MRPQIIHMASNTALRSDCLRIERRNLSRGKKAKRQKHTTGGIPRWSPTLVLVARFSAYVWQSGRDAQFSLTYGRMYSDRANTQYNLSRDRAPRRKQAASQHQKCKETKGQTPDDKQLTTIIPASPFPDAQDNSFLQGCQRGKNCGFVSFSRSTWSHP